MLIKDVIDILKEQRSSLDLTSGRMYAILFTDEDLDDVFRYEAKSRQYFNTRPFAKDMLSDVSGNEGFPTLIRRVQTRYLSSLNQPSQLYNPLEELIKVCPFLPDSYKQLLAGSCSSNDEYQLARFISACILLSDYHKTFLKGNEHEYRYNIDFMRLTQSGPDNALSLKIWKGSQQSFIQSHKEGNRFYDLNIIQRLLPSGYVATENFKIRAKTKTGEIKKLKDICNESTRDIAVTGEGGIGKTTFLQQLLEDEFWNDNNEVVQHPSGNPIPIFIELRRCPSSIGDWYQDIHKKTNFVTRYIAQLIEGHNSLDAVSEELLKDIEKELQKSPVNNTPQYLLLLDGFNEVSVSGRSQTQSCRAILSKEISALHTDYPNVRIIATSRETQSAYFTTLFDNVRLIGLEDDDVTQHLFQSGFTTAEVGMILSNKALMKCLRTPLFLCMYSYERTALDLLLPETQGEILYNFFHKNSFFYNARMRTEQIRTNHLSDSETALILDFILPYIGWYMESNDIFSVSSKTLQRLISDAMGMIELLLLSSDTVPYADFAYDADLLQDTYNGLKDKDNYVKAIISCAFDYLGILYQYDEPENSIAERTQYSFIHHYFRDYFSAILDIQLLRMLSLIDSDRFIGSVTDNFTYEKFLNSTLWNQGKSELISQILLEHHNKPQCHPVTRNWYLPNFIADEAKVLTDAIDFCRKLGEKHPIHHLLRNTLRAIVYGRGELSGMDLSDLNFKLCNIFSVPCSKKGLSATLAAKFDRAILPDNFLEPEDHLDHIEEYVYSSHNCYTIDNNGVIKCWDILSGYTEYVLYSGEPNGMNDFSPNGFIKASSDGRWLAAKSYANSESDQSGYLNVFDLEHTDQPPFVLKTTVPTKTITNFAFTFDNKSILFLSDCHHLYCYDIETQTEQYHIVISDFYKQTDIYAQSAMSYVYAFSADYDRFRNEEFLLDYDEEDELLDEDPTDSDNYFEYEDSIHCTLLKCNPLTQKVENIYDFTGTAMASPVARYFPELDGFILYNDGSKHLEYVSCRRKTSHPVWEEITADNDDPMPSSIQYCPDSSAQCYIFYPTCCYHVDLKAQSENGILMKYNLRALNVGQEDNVKSDDYEDPDELLLYPNVMPTMNRFIVKNSENTYEWDTANDTLRRRYNVALYDCRDLMIDQMHHLAIFVHQFNGVSIFSGDKPKLTNAFCYPNAEYYVGGCCYHEETMNLALMFCKVDHEYIEIINIKSGHREIVFSTQLPHETLKGIQFHSSGQYLLITLADRCLEYALASKQNSIVNSAGANELYLDGGYVGENDKEISIAIAEHFNYEEPHIEPHCDQYSIHRSSSHGISYRREWRYYMPTLTEETARDFLHYCYDIGDGGSYSKDEYQTYWVTSGFFLTKYPDDKAFQNIQCVRFVGNREIKETKAFERMQTIFCRHDFELTSRYRTEEYSNSYAYCSDDASEVFQVVNYHDVLHWKNAKTDSISEKYVYDNGTETSDEMSYAYIDALIPWGENSAIACYEQYHLMLIKKKGTGVSLEIPYTPGIAINDCTFYDVKANEELLQELQINGASI